MRLSPLPRWFRFRLSTMLIVTAIAAWGMACWPFRVVRVGYTYLDGSTEPVAMHASVHWNGWLLAPALALAGFFIWKAAWALVERRRRRSVAAE